MWVANPHSFFMRYKEKLHLLLHITECLLTGIPASKHVVTWNGLGLTETLLENTSRLSPCHLQSSSSPDLQNDSKLGVMSVSKQR